MSDEYLLITLAAVFAALLLLHVLTRRISGAGSRAVLLSRIGLMLVMVGIGLTVLSMVTIPDKAILPGPLASNILVGAGVTLVVGVALCLMIALSLLAMRFRSNLMSVVTSARSRDLSLIASWLTGVIAIAAFILRFVLEDFARRPEQADAVLVDYGDESTDFNASAYYSDGAIDYYAPTPTSLTRQR